MTTITTTLQPLQDSSIRLHLLHKVETPEERGLALFQKLQEYHNLPQETSNFLASLEEDFQKLPQKTLILAKLYYEMLIPLQQKLADPFFDERKNELLQILESLLPQGMLVEDYLIRYKKVQLTLKTAQAIQQIYEEKTKDAVRQANNDMATFVENTKATQTKAIKLHQEKSAFHVIAVKESQKATAQVEKIQQKTEEMAHDLKSLNERITAHDKELAEELKKLWKKGEET